MENQTISMGEFPKDVPNMTIEEIIKDIERLTTNEAMTKYSRWLNDGPSWLRGAVLHFRPYKIYAVMAGAKNRYAVTDSIVSPYSFAFDYSNKKFLHNFTILISPIGCSGIVTDIDPQFLRFVTVTELRIMEKQSDASGDTSQGPELPDTHSLG